MKLGKNRSTKSNKKKKNTPEIRSPLNKETQAIEKKMEK